MHGRNYFIKKLQQRSNRTCAQKSDFVSILHSAVPVMVQLVGQKIIVILIVMRSTVVISLTQRVYIPGFG